MNYLKAIPAIEAAAALPIREIMESSRLEKVRLEKISLAEGYPFETHEDFAMHDLIEEIRVS